MVTSDQGRVWASGVGQYGRDEGMDVGGVWGGDLG
jgi:hypothetical protein